MSSTWNRLVSASASSLWQTPVAGDGRTLDLLAGLASATPPPEAFAVRSFQPLPPIATDAAERPIEADQTHRSVVVGEHVVVKWLTPPPPLPQPAPDLFAHLAAVGFVETAPPYAALSWRSPDGPELLLALVTGFLPEARDGWEWCVDEAVDARTAFAGDLGRLAAGLHNAVATPSPVFPEPVRHDPPGSSWAALGASWLTRAEEALDEALELTGGEDGAWLTAHASALREGLSALRAPCRTALIRIHGDLHVGQILRWRDGYAVIDFDGNPTLAGADPFQPAARDLAQLTTSIEHVGQIAIKRRDAAPAAIAAWTATCRRALLAEYGRHLAPGLLDPSSRRAFEIEQECRELIYAARHLPRWTYAPMGVLRTWFP